MKNRFPFKPIWAASGIAAALWLWIWLMGHDFTSVQAATASTALLMGWLWFTQALPLAATSLVPLAVFPLFGVLSLEGTFLRYLNPYIWLFAGGMVVGSAMSYTGLSRRLALSIIHTIGVSPGRLLLGILVASAFISMWISNTATAIMMITIVLALLRQVTNAASWGRLPRFGAAAVLAVAYGSNVGGIGTKIGTPPNSYMASYLGDHLGIELSFLDYLPVGLPFMALFLPVVWLVLWLFARREAHHVRQAFTEVIAEQRVALGTTSRREQMVAIIFGLAAVLWVFGDLVRPVLVAAAGIEIKGNWYEAGVAIMAALTVLVASVVPPRALVRGESRVEWSVLVLLGGSYALASGIEASGLGGIIGPTVTTAAGSSLTQQLGVASFATVALTAFVANTAALVMLSTLLPQVAAVLLTATIASSCDFALVYGTPPNTIAWGTGYVTAQQMFMVGIALDVLAALLLVPYGLYLHYLIGGS